MRKFVKEYSQQFVDQVPGDLMEMRNEDDIVERIVELAYEIEASLPNNIRYLGYTIDDSLGKYIENDERQSDKKSSSKSKKEIKISYKSTFSKLVKFRFELTQESIITNEFQKAEKVTLQKEVEMAIRIPQLINNTYLIKDSRYIAPLQLVDSLTYSKKDMVIIKTLSRALKITRDKKNITDIHNIEYKTQCFNYHLNAKKKIPILLYYFANFGFYNSMKYFGINPEMIELIELDIKENIHDIADNKNFIYFKFGQLFMKVPREAFNKSIQLRQYIGTTMSILSAVVGSRSTNVDDVKQVSRWLIKLGSFISSNKNTSTDKGESLLRSFIISLDLRTQNLISQLIPNGERKQDIFSLVRYIIINFNSLSSITSTDLSNKRLRLGEYLVSPLVRTINNKIVRYLKTPTKNKHLMDRLADIFKVNKDLIIHCINGKINIKDYNLNIMRFCNDVNDNNITNLFKISQRGPGSANEGKNISIQQRGFDLTSIGKIDHLSTSNGDPGMSIILNPFCHIETHNGTFMSKEDKEKENERRIK